MTTILIIVGVALLVVIILAFLTLRNFGKM
jgi:hypothetical protein